MKDLTPFELADLIYLKIRNEISEKDQKELDEWLEESVRNRDLYLRLLRDAENIEKEKLNGGEHDYSDYYRLCCYKIDSDRRRKRIRVLLKVAAVAIPVAVLSVLWLGKEKNLNVKQIISDKLTESGIRPGSSNAVLILSDGKRVELKPASNDGNKPILNENIKIDSDTIKYLAHNKENEPVTYNTLIIPRGGEFVLKLSDGTTVMLNSESELKYPVRFYGSERRVYLKGEAYFSVAKNADLPFRVVSGEQTVTVLGTEFCIRAYSDESSILTTLESGKVSVVKGDEKINLVPGQQSTAGSKGIEVKEVNTRLYTAWKDNVYMFDNESLGDILHTLSRWYDMDVYYDSDDLQGLRFTGELMKYSDIGQFLEKLQELEKVRFKIKGNRVIVDPY
jgi:ferric-dicitrate binding protein FerR (iron transport regulator)